MRCPMDLCDGSGWLRSERGAMPCPHVEKAEGVKKRAKAGGASRAAAPHAGQAKRARRKA